MSDKVFVSIAATVLGLFEQIEHPVRIRAREGFQTVGPSLFHGILRGHAFGAKLRRLPLHHILPPHWVQFPNFATGFLLLTITFIPFPTAVLAEYLPAPQANIAVPLYSVATLFLNLGTNVWWQSAHWPVYLLSPSLAKSDTRKGSIQLFSGFVILAITTVISY